MSFFISALILLLLLICGSVVIANKFDWGDLTESAKRGFQKRFLAPLWTPCLWRVVARISYF